MSSGIDRLAILTPERLETLRTNAPVDWCAFYMNSPCQRLTEWTPELVRELAPHVDGLLPIYVGSQDESFGCQSVLTAAQALDDAQDALTQLELFGARPLAGLPCVLDIEAPTYQNRPTQTLIYATAWASVIQDWGYWPVFYSTGECLSKLADYWGERAFYWLASWVYSRYSVQASYGLRNRATASRLPYDRALWQYATEPRNPALGEAVDWNEGAPPLLKASDLGL